MVFPALWVAAAQGETVEVHRLLAEGAAIEERGGPNESSPLTVAAWAGYEGTVRVLLEHGADVSSRDCGGGTPLTGAKLQGYEAVAVLLLEASAAKNNSVS
ncbi:ankyrin repeat-containing domain protein [Baffinella frigidus]|nr:ankyrin repeat-containing domain protein [Cryptophyta sp. CCMP2293]